jgi:ribulose-5-phosphate 4-epimerase/fuculose-1-phosphate aldolase
VRHDAHCVLHLHTAAGVAVSAQKDGLLPISQQALFPLSALSYHAYEGVALNPEEKPRLVADLGENNFMILRNHGLLTCGDTVAQAFLNMYILQRSCEVQVMAQASGQALLSIPQPILAGIQAMSKTVTRGAGAELAWPGLLRKMDRLDPGYAN